MDTIFITLPDGKVLDMPRGTTAVDVAKKISPRLASAALVARATYGPPPAPGPGAAEDAASGQASTANGSELVDLSRPLERDAKLEILTEKDPDALFVFRHSAAHLLAAAVTELFPDVQLGIGPPIDTGFFYEFVREQPFMLKKIWRPSKSACMTLLRATCPNERKFLPKAEAHRAVPEIESDFQM